MSVRPDRGAERWTSLVATIAFVGVAAAALIWRLQLNVLPSRERILALSALYGAVLLASLLAPAAPSTRHLPSTVVLLGGIVGVAGAAWAAGVPFPFPWGAQTVAVSILAAVAEEALFRRAAYAALEPYGASVAIVVTAVLFALMHIPLYGLAALPVDLGAGLLFGWQRWASGTWTVPATTHAFANVLAVLGR